MTIDEAIKHCEEVARNCEDQASQCDVDDRYERHVMHENAKCAADHRQLAEWLGELRQAKAIILDMSYTLEVICGKYKAEVGCAKCPYSDGGCRVKSWIARQRDFCKGEGEVK